MYRYVQNKIGEAEYREIKVYVNAGHFKNVKNINKMTMVDFIILKNLVSLASEYSQLSNLVYIHGTSMFNTSISFVTVKDLEAFRPVIKRFQTMYIHAFISFRQSSDNIKIEKTSEFAEWGIEFNYHDEPKTRISFKGIQIGDIKVDDILIESDDKNVAESLKEAINELMSKYEEHKTNKLEIEKTMQAKKSKKEKCDNELYTHDKFIRFIGESFDGYEITEMRVNHKNATAPVLNIIPEIRKIFDLHSGEWEEGEYTIIITNTGICLIICPTLTMMISMRDDKLGIQVVNKDFVDTLTTGNNAKYIAVELRLDIK